MGSFLRVCNRLANGKLNLKIIEIANDVFLVQLNRREKLFLSQCFKVK